MLLTAGPLSSPYKLLAGCADSFPELFCSASVTASTTAGTDTASDTKLMRAFGDTFDLGCEKLDRPRSLSMQAWAAAAAADAHVTSRA